MEAKEKYIQGNINTNYTPCDDFYNFAAGEMDLTGLRTGLENYVLKLIKDSKNHALPVMRNVYEQYETCDKDEIPFVELNMTERVAFVLKRLKDIQFPIQPTDHRITDENKYRRLIFRMYRALLERGSRLLNEVAIEAAMGFTFLRPSTFELSEDETGPIWDAYCAASNCTSRDKSQGNYVYRLDQLKNTSIPEFVSIFFRCNISSIKQVYTPVCDNCNEGNEMKSRASLVNELFEALMFRQPYTIFSCILYVKDVFPAYLQKLALDDAKKNLTNFNLMKEDFFTVFNSVYQASVDALGRSRAFKDKVFMKHIVKGLRLSKMMFFDYPVYEDATFLKYFASSDFSKPFTHRLMNNVIPLIKFASETKNKVAYIPSVDEKARYFAEKFSLGMDWALTLPPIYQTGLSPVILFSSIGSIIGHEIAHFFNAVFNLAFRYPELQKMKDCVVNLYKDQCSPQNKSICIDSELSFAETFPDIMGAQWSYSAFKTYTLHKQSTPAVKSRLLHSMSDDVIFFINLAQTWAYGPDWSRFSPARRDPHPPAPVRIFGMLANFPAFTNAFRCELGSKYNPTKKCDTFIVPNEFQIITHAKGNDGVFIRYTYNPSEKNLTRHRAFHVRYEFSTAMGMRTPKKCTDGFDVVKLKSGKKLVVPRVIDNVEAKRRRIWCILRIQVPGDIVLVQVGGKPRPQIQATARQRERRLPAGGEIFQEPKKRRLLHAGQKFWSKLSRESRRACSTPSKTKILIGIGSERSAFYPIPELATTHIHAKKVLNVEDAESLLYMSLGMMATLPWAGMKNIEEIRKAKLECTDVCEVPTATQSRTFVYCSCVVR
ncbi:unnamed protein product [Bursaphelenchus xylophilus]|uniref:(pine wood nematode) hypothetical protein n=1 Tax=Bursaphelenchus xylophilus TaxID=6326 RepID=A0A7I8WXY9_BURXY|nr:unnamed protein product [Bursaphelenchus xylophilus]CAG9100771.1 unnamed protein product [Bursaphelenchus xylophilus]